tara:strand:- start:13426 stop:14307 length:882 start_codon:yes stop_codon:yes gene_type:complete
MFDTSEVKKRLLHSVAELIEARETCIAVTTQLRKLGTRKERVDDISDLLMNLLDKVFHEVENELEAQYCRKYAVKITVDEPFYQFMRHAFRQEKVYWSNDVYDTLRASQSKPPHDQVIELERLIHGMPWDAIKASLDEQCNNVKNLALKSAIHDIHSFLSLDCFYGKAVLKKECLVASREFDNHSWSVTGHVHAIQTLKQALSYIAEDTGLEVGSSLDELKKDIVHYGQARIPVPPRSRYGKGTAIDVTVFKAKITFTFSPSAVEAIQAATMLYGDDRQIERLMDVITPANAA